MPDSFRRLFTRPAPRVLSLNAQAALGPVRQPERSQFSLLLRHFLERFFNHEAASPDGNAKARLVLIALTVGLPGFVVALYLWPDYHSFIPYLRNGRVIWIPGPPPYWLQVNHHLFFVLYSFVAAGIVTVFEWDLFFPGLLDIFVLTTLPVPDHRLFRARVAAIAVLIGGFLFDANILASLVLPATFDPPSLPRFLAGHLLSVAAAGLFSAASILALQGVLLSLFGERLFRRFSLLMQGLSIAVLLMLLFLFPVFSGAVPVFLQSGSIYARCFPPFWFLGIYQRLMEGPSAPFLYVRLAQTGCVALLAMAGLAMLSYPVAYLRKVRQLAEGPGTRHTRTPIERLRQKLFHATLLRSPVRRAVFHFISQTLLRVQRYRIYLVLYGGVGLSVVIASVLRITIVHQQVHLATSADGIRSAAGIVPFWTIAGLRMAFVSSGNQRGGWVFRIVHGRPPHFPAAIEQLLAAKLWVLLWAGFISLGCCLALRAIAPPELLPWRATTSQLLVTAGMSLVLTDIFFLNVKIVAFTGEPAREQSNLAVTALKFFAFAPAAAWLPLAIEPWIELSIRHLALAAAAIAIVHLALRMRHRGIVQEHSSLCHLEDDEEEFPLKLGLRY